MAIWQKHVVRTRVTYIWHVFDHYTYTVNGKVYLVGEQNVCLCVYSLASVHTTYLLLHIGGRITRALKLHRYHVRFQRFIRTNDRGRRNSSSSPLLSSGNSFSIMFWGAVGFICDIEIAFFQYVS